jgi:hypothetical protein
MTPVERPVAQIASGQKPRTAFAFEPVSAPKDQAVLPLLSRVSSQRLDEIQEAMSQLDFDVLLLVQQLQLVSGSQLRRCFWPTAEESQELVARRARRVLGRLADWRIIDRTRLRAAGGRGGGSESFSWCVGPAGHRLLVRIGCESRRLGAPGDRYVRHTLAISELVTSLIERDRQGDVELVAWESEPSCWRGFLSGYGGRQILKPDLFVRLGAGTVYEQRAFIEVDMATETPATIAGKLSRYVSYARTGIEQAESGTFAAVVWLALDEQRADVLRREVQKLERAERPIFTVATQDVAIQALRGLVEVPQ